MTAHKVSSVLLAAIAAAGAAALVIEGADSYLSRFSLEDRITELEQRVHELDRANSALYELLVERAEEAPTSAIRIEKTARSIDHEDLDLFCLAKNVFHEAGVEDELGMFAVAQVTVNRVRSANYPNTVCEVVMQPRQFSWTNNSSRRWTHPSGPKWDAAKRIARQVILEGYRVPALQSAMFYHADYNNPDWRDPEAVVAQVGTHIFYTRSL